MNNTIKRTWNQGSLVNIEDLRGMTFQAESGGHTFVISAVDADGNAVAMSGTPAGTMLRPDNTDQALTCSISGGNVYATLPAGCYDVPGRAGITIFLTSGGQKTAIYAAVVSVTRTQSGTASPGTTASVVDLINAINTAISGIPATDTALKAAMAPTYSNSALYAVGDYAWYNGTLYRCTTAITTAETWTSGHWTTAAIGTDSANELRGLKSALESASEEIEDIKDNLYSEYDVVFQKTETVSQGDYSSSKKLMDVNIPTGSVIKYRLSSESALFSTIMVYGEYNGGGKYLTYGAEINTDYTYIADYDFTAIRLYKPNGMDASGVLVAKFEYTKENSNSFEERIDNLESAQQGNVTDKNLGFFDKKTLSGSANRFDPSKLIREKSINLITGVETTDTSYGVYYLNVSPSDHVYFWRIHTGDVETCYSNGIAAYAANGSFSRSDSQSGYIYDFTVPAGIYKLGLIIPLNFIDNDFVEIIFNNSTAPDNKPEIFYEPGDYYFNKYDSLKYVDFSLLLPYTGKSPLPESVVSVAHAGLSGYYPIDTDLSIIGAKKAGFTGVEMDVQITQDGVYVLYHDDNMVRVGGTASQTIANMDYEDLLGFDYGSWMGSRFAGTELCTFDKAVMLCKILDLRIYIDCKGISTAQQFAGAEEIVEKWGMKDKTYWINANFGTCWEAIPDAKILFATASKLLGSSWPEDDGWFYDLPANYPGKYEVVEGVPRFKDDVYFGVLNNYNLMNDQTYGLEGLKDESEVAKKYNIKYGLYAPDDIDDIYTLVTGIPNLSLLEGNKIATQNAVNKKLGIMMADYILP